MTHDEAMVRLVFAALDLARAAAAGDMPSTRAAMQTIENIAEKLDARQQDQDQQLHEPPVDGGGDPA